MQNARPRALALADTASGGRIAELISEQSARRATYQSIADQVHDEFGVRVSRDMIRRWVAVDLAEAAS